MRVVLLSMPFAPRALPSLGLTQIASVLASRFGARVQVETHYLNLEFARYFGRAHYDHAVSGAGFMTGMGDWFFRDAAFPGVADNCDEYFARYYFGDDEETRTLRAVLREKRAGLQAFLDEQISRLRLAGADVVGFTTLFAQTTASLAMAHRLKVQNPGVVTCIGGSACLGEMGQALARLVPQLDYVFSGPALVSFPTLVGHLLDGRREDGDRIAGVFSKTNAVRWQSEAEAVHPADPETQVALLGEDLDINENVQLDYAPFLDATDHDVAGGAAKRALLFETSRGCYWARHSPCTFCGLNGVQLVHHALTPENARAQIESLFRWAPRCSSFIAVDTIMPRGYVQDVFAGLVPPDGMKLMYEVRPVLTSEELAVLVAAGVVALQPGIEALSTSTLKLMRKGTSAFRNIQFLKASSKHPVSLDWNLLIGSPGEPEATYEKYRCDLPLLSHLAPPSGAYPINFVRHSRYFEKEADYGLALRPQDFYALTYPFAPAELRALACQFVDDRAEGEQLDRWLVPLNELTARWRTRWLGQDGLIPARLCLVRDEHSPCIYDSRSGEEREYPLDGATLALLDTLAEPRDEEQHRADPALAWLRERGLLFEEDGRVLSLVVE